MIPRAGFRSFAFVLGLVAASASPSKAGFVVTAEAAGVQSSQLSGVVTEKFSAIATGRYSSLTTAVGTISSPSIAILSADNYGGAGGAGRYAAIGSVSGSLTAILSIGSAQSYFGFWWSAADAQNQVDFLADGKVVATFNPTTALGALGGGYFGNPNNSSNSGEKYAYLNFYATDGSSFDQVRFTNLNAGSGFETDNWSIRSTPVITAYSGSVISGGVAGSVPEPSSLAMVAVGAVGLAFGHLRRKRPA